MPIYEFVCDNCGMRFEKRKPMAKHAEGDTCPSCGTDARKVVSSVNHTFAHTPVGGPRPQNTGVHAIDYSYDRVIGRDAAARRQVVEERQAYKRKVLRDNPGASGHDLSRTHEGDYRVMKPEERRAAESARALHQKAMNAVEASKNTSSPSGGGGKTGRG